MDKVFTLSRKYERYWLPRSRVPGKRQCQADGACSARTASALPLQYATASTTALCSHGRQKRFTGRRTKTGCPVASTKCRSRLPAEVRQEARSSNFRSGGARRLPSSMVARARSGRAGVVYKAHLLSLQRVPQKRRQRCSYVGIAPSWYLFHPCRRVRRTEFHELLVDRFDCAASMQRISVVWNTGAP